MSLYNLTPALYARIAQHLADKYDDSFYTRGILAKSEIAGGVQREIVALSSCDKRLRRLLFDTVFDSVCLGQRGDARTKTCKSELEWLLRSRSKVLETARVLQLHDFMPDAFGIAAECISHMTAVRRLIIMSSVGIHAGIAASLDKLPHLGGISAFAATLDSMPALTTLSSKVASYELNFWRYSILARDCLAQCPHIAAPRDARDPTSQASPAEFSQKMIDQLARLLVRAKDTIEVLYIDQRNDVDPDWFERVLAQANRLTKKGKFSMPSLKRLRLESVALPPAILRELLSGSPLLTHVGLSILREPELGTRMPALPLLKRLNVFDAEVPKRFPVFYSSLLAGATLDHLYLNGINPLDVGDLLNAPDFFSARSLRTLDVAFDGKQTLSPYHFEKLSRACVNLESFTFSNGQFTALPAPYFQVLARLPKLARISLDHPWDSARVGQNPLEIHDGKTIRSEVLGNFRIIACAGTSIHQEVRNRIRSDDDGCRPLYKKRFRAVARAHPSLQEIEWKPTPELTWNWKFSRAAEGSLQVEEDAQIDFDKIVNGDVPQSGVLMLAQVSRSDIPLVQSNFQSSFQSN
ncbi:hypothetical protein JCM3766R1_001591 [Sporobolomyces carnicolor]